VNSGHSYCLGIQEMDKEQIIRGTTTAPPPPPSGSCMDHGWGVANRLTVTPVAQYGGLPEVLPAGASKPQPAGDTSVARAGDGKQLKNSVQCGAYPSFCRLYVLLRPLRSSTTVRDSDFDTRRKSDTIANWSW
jgi:hypothetical protein